MRGRLGRSLPVKLSLTAAPPRIDEQTLVVRGAVPRTNLGGVARSYAGGHVGSAIGASLVKGLNPQPGARAPDTRLRAGDVIAMRLPDAAIDGGDSRPGLKVEGNARVVMLAGNGAVLEDITVSDSVVQVPPHSAIIALQANGDTAEVTGPGQARVAGWHDQSRVVRLAGRSALASGCVIHMDGAAARRQVGWGVAADVVREAAAVSTRFSGPVRCIGVVLRGVEARLPDDLGIELHGASHVSAAGEPVEPVVIQAGARSILLFAVRADSPGGAVSVRVVQGGARQVSGVFGADAELDPVADWVAELGLVAVVARLRAASGDGCAIEWLPAEDG